MVLTMVELSRIKLEPNEVLSVKLFGDDYEPEDVEGLKAQLSGLFPNNKVMMFVLPAGKDLQMEAISANLEDKKNSVIAELQQKAIDDSLEMIRRSELQTRNEELIAILNKPQET